jgi:isovaleryl-CoA dehydrogenase
MCMTAQFGQPSVSSDHAGQNGRYACRDECGQGLRLRSRACDDGRRAESAAGAIPYAAERATWMALSDPAPWRQYYINDFLTGRIARRLYEIGARTSEIRRMLIGREIFDKTTR